VPPLNTLVTRQVVHGFAPYTLLPGVVLDGIELRAATTAAVSTVCRGVPVGVLTSRCRLRPRARAVPAFDGPRRVLPRDRQRIIDVGQRLESGEGRERVEQVKPTHGIDSQGVGPLHHDPQRMLIPQRNAAHVLRKETAAPVELTPR
jgi:hypothetical protein